MLLDFFHFSLSFFETCTLVSTTRQEIYVKGDNTAIFHISLTLIILAWLITLFTYVFRFAGWCTESKAVMQMIQTKGKNKPDINIS